MMGWNMQLEKILLLTIANAFLFQEISVSGATVELTENVIKQQLKRFAAVKDAFQAANLNVSVIFSQSTYDEDDIRTKHDSIEFQSLSPKFNPEGPKREGAMSETILKNILKFSKRLNVSSVVSHEVYKPDGSLESKDLYSEKIKIQFNNGASNINFEDREAELEDTEVDEFLDIIKELELPIRIHKVTFSENDEVTYMENSIYEPQKVTIISATNMPVGIQMAAAEALKRSYNIKQDTLDRIALVCRFLGIQYSDYVFEAVAGGGNHHIKSDLSVNLELKGEVYTIWGSIKEK